MKNTLYFLVASVALIGAAYANDTRHSAEEINGAMQSIHIKADACKYFGEPAMSVVETADFQIAIHSVTPYLMLVYHWGKPEGFKDDGSQGGRYLSGVEIYTDHEKIAKWKLVYTNVGPVNVY